MINEQTKLLNDSQPVDGDQDLADDLHRTEDALDDEPEADLNPSAQEYDRQPRQNFVTGIPEDDFDDEEKPVRKNLSGAVLPIVFAGVAIVLVIGIALFFILRGRPSAPETVVKDNSAKIGASANSNLNAGSSPDFGKDYDQRYGANSSANSALLNPNSNPAGSTGNSNASAANPGMMQPNYGTVGTTVTALPPPNYDGSTTNPNNNLLNQPPKSPQTDPNAAASAGSSQAPGNQAASNGASGNGGGRSNPNHSPQESARSKANNLEISESSGNASSRNASSNGNGGRNEQTSLFFYDRDDDANGLTGGGSINGRRIELERSPIAKPSFGTVLPVRIMGRLHTLGANGLARMELTRTVQGSWGTIPGGTLFVGRMAGGQGNRVFVSLIGYIDSRSNRLVTLGGDLQGTDGALGMQGDVKHLGSRWTKAFGEMLSTAKQVGSAYLLGRSGGGGTVINNGGLERTTDALSNNDSNRYVVVPAGTSGYLVMNDLPPSIELRDQPGSQYGSTQPLSDEELLKMIQSDNPSDIQHLMPGLSPRAQEAAQSALTGK